VLHNFRYEVNLDVAGLAFYTYCVQNFGKFADWKFNVDDCADNLNYFTFRQICVTPFLGK
jgi:hypothetical protein